MKDSEKDPALTHKPARRVFVDMRTEEDHVFMEWAHEIGSMMEERYRCGRCGDCCHQDSILILDEDREEMARFLRLRPIDFRTRYLRRMKGEWFLKQGNPCSFLSEDQKSCTIYPVRPKICRAFPYQTPWFIKGIFDFVKFEPRDNPPFILYMGEECPCRENIRERTRKTALDFLSDEKRMESAAARGVANFRQKQTRKEVSVRPIPL
jgi:Fe-S-cluster containining protein